MLPALASTLVLTVVGGCAAGIASYQVCIVWLKPNLDRTLRFLGTAIRTLQQFLSFFYYILGGLVRRSRDSREGTVQYLKVVTKPCPVGAT